MFIFFYGCIEQWFSTFCQSQNPLKVQNLKAPQSKMRSSIPSQQKPPIHIRVLTPFTPFTLESLVTFLFSQSPPFILESSVPSSLSYQSPNPPTHFTSQSSVLPFRSESSIITYSSAHFPFQIRVPSFPPFRIGVLCSLTLSHQSPQAPLPFYIGVLSPHPTSISHQSPQSPIPFHIKVFSSFPSYTLESSVYPSLLHQSPQFPLSSHIGVLSPPFPFT